MFAKDRLKQLRPPKTWHVEEELCVTPQQLSQQLRGFLSAELREGRFEIPPLPRLATELNDMASSANPDLVACQRLIERDPPLAARVMTLADSAAFGATTAVRDLQQAVVRIGCGGLRDVAFSVMMSRVFNCGSLRSRMSLELRRSYVVGRLTQEIARMLGLENKYGFLCGLLADIGKAALLATLAELGRENEMWLREEAVDEILRDLHAEAGAAVLGYWKLSSVLKAVARWHHEPERAEAVMPLAYAVSAADRLIELRTPDSRAFEARLAAEPVFFRAGLSPDQLPALIDILGDAEQQAAGAVA